MSIATPTKFLHALAQEKLTNTERWVALVWWYSKQDRAPEATPRRICQDMEASGYGRQHITRVTNALSKDRRLTRGRGEYFGVRITASADLDSTFSRFLQPPTSTTSSTNPVATGSTLPSASQAKEKPTKRPKGKKPALFIGSSAEGLKPARALEKQLEHHAEVTIWKDGVFGLGGGTLEALVNDLPKYDFAALVLTPDDLTESRGRNQSSPRDNVVFELGLFMGRLGRFRTFIVYNKDADMKLPSDLAGVTAATFGDRSDENYHAQMSPPSTLIIDAIEKQGKLTNS